MQPNLTKILNDKAMELERTKNFKLTDGQVFALAQAMPDDVSFLEFATLVAFLAEEVYGFKNEEIKSLGQKLIDLVEYRKGQEK